MSQHTRRFVSLAAMGWGLLAVGSSLPLPASPGSLPGFVELAELDPSPPNSDHYFGLSVAIDGDRIVVGAPGDNLGGDFTGAAYVFERVGPESWAEVAKLVVGDAYEGNWVGASVAISGERAVVGAPYKDFFPGVSQGAAYVYQKDASGAWILESTLLASDSSNRDIFGFAVGISGERIVVGAKWDDPVEDRSGSAYVFELDDTGSWLEVAKLVPSDAAQGDEFGSSVAIEGDRIVVGADSGRPRKAYVFERGESGTWEAFRLVPSDGASIGDAVAIEGDRIAVGTRDEGFPGLSAGAVYLFERQDTGVWTDSAKLVAANGADEDGLGLSVAISGDRVIAGTEETASVYVFERDGPGLWSQAAELSTEDASVFFGLSVSLDSELLVVGHLSGAFVFSSELALSTAGECPGEAVVSARGLTPNGQARLFWAATEGSFVLASGPCQGTELGLRNPRPLGLLTADETGLASLTKTLSASQCGRLVQVVDVTTCETSAVVSLP